MNCPSCGIVVTEGLSYCNRCGAKLMADTKSLEVSAASGKIITHLSVVTGSIALVGFILAFVLAIILIQAKFDREPLLMLVFSFLLATFCITGMLIRQLSRALDAHIHSASAKKPPKTDKPQASNLTAHQAAQIESPREHFVSVTENTTRTLSPMTVEQETTS